MTTISSETLSDTDKVASMWVRIFCHSPRSFPLFCIHRISTTYHKNPSNCQHFQHHCVIPAVRRHGILCMSLAYFLFFIFFWKSHQVSFAVRLLLGAHSWKQRFLIGIPVSPTSSRHTHMMKRSPRPCSCDPNESNHNPDNYVCYESVLERHSNRKHQASNNRVKGRTVYNVYVCGGVLAHELDPFREDLHRPTYMLKKAVCCTADKNCWGCRIITGHIKDTLDRDGKSWRIITIHALWDEWIRIGHKRYEFQDGEVAPTLKPRAFWFQRTVENQSRLQRLQSLHPSKENHPARS